MPDAVLLIIEQVRDAISRALPAVDDARDRSILAQPLLDTVETSLQAARSALHGAVAQLDIIEREYAKPIEPPPVDPAHMARFVALMAVIGERSAADEKWVRELVAGMHPLRMWMREIFTLSFPNALARIQRTFLSNRGDQ